jgi:hypothetical protein
MPKFFIPEILTGTFILDEQAGAALFDVAEDFIKREYAEDNQILRRLKSGQVRRVARLSFAEISTRHYNAKKIISSLGHDEITRESRVALKKINTISTLLGEVSKHVGVGHRNSVENFEDRLGDAIDFLEAMTVALERRGSANIRTGRPKTYAWRSTIHYITDLFSFIAAREFKMTLDVAPHTSGKKRFVQPDARFVFDVSSALDPAITLSNVVGALQTYKRLRKV